MSTAGPARYPWAHVTHHEVVDLLPGYAAGRLDEAHAKLVRAHLSSGCLDCLHAVFEPHPDAARRPPGAVPVPSPPARAPAERKRRRPAMVSMLAIGLIMGALLAVTLHWRERAAVQQGEARRLALALTSSEDTRATLARSLDEARTEVEQQHEAARAAAREGEETRRALGEAEERIAALSRRLRERDAEIERLAANDALHDLLIGPGVQLLPLAPVAPFGDARGHVLWHPERTILMVFGVGLLPGRRYRVEVAGDAGLLAPAPQVVPGARGDAAVALRLGVAADRLRMVSIVLEPGGKAVLAGHRR